MRAKLRVSQMVGIIAVVALAAACASAARAASFMLVAMPDIQNETQYHPEMLQSQINWILNNRASQNIVFVAQQGDLTNNANTAEYTTAHDALFRLNGASGLAWGTCPGNHDLANPDGLTTAISARRTSPARVGTATPPTATVRTRSFRPAAARYLVLNIAYDAPASVLDWAQARIDDHRGMPTIINTHDYMAYGNTRSPYGNTLWDSLAKNNQQVFMVLCGHNHYAYNQTSPDAAGKPVCELLADYQDTN